MMAGRYWLKGFLERFPNLKKKPKTFPSIGLLVPINTDQQGLSGAHSVDHGMEIGIQTIPHMEC